jgi:hypothetical protein
MPVRFVGLLGKARVAMQIDVGFGDVVTPGAVDITYPTLLDFQAPTLSGYPRETVVAEKFQAPRNRDRRRADRVHAGVHRTSVDQCAVDCVPKEAPKRRVSGDARRRCADPRRVPATDRARL